MYLFDEYDSADRSPQGALADDGSLGLRIRCRRGLCRSAQVVCRTDDHEVIRQPLSWAKTSGQYDCFTCEIVPPKADLYWYWFELDTTEGFRVIDRNGMGEGAWRPFQLTVHDRNLRTPDWIKGGVMYHIFVDRYRHGGAPGVTLKPGAVFRDDWGGVPTFAPDEQGVVRNNDFFGGNLEGIIDKLPHLQQMGVTCLYLSPVFDAASNHKYDIGDYLRLDPGFGDEATFPKLCREAKRHGMRVILDGVFSHVGIDSVYFNRYGRYNSVGAYQSTDSPYYPWFSFEHWPDKYDSWWGIELLPMLNKRDESYRSFVSEPGGVIDHWMTQGTGGWRLDVVDELPDVFLDPLCAAVRRGDPDALIVGEVWEDASNKIAYDQRRRYLLGGQLDSVMNYPLKDAILAYVKEGRADVLADTMAELTQNYPKAVLDCLMNILGTHDTMRILTVLGGEQFPDNKADMSRFALTHEQREHGKTLLKIASALQFTLPGFPCVYYGDEAGMEGGADPFNRRCYPWGHEDDELLSWYRQLAGLRRALPVFREGRYSLVAARDGVFAFMRTDEHGSVLIAANVSGDDATLPIAVTFDWLHNTAVSACVVPCMSVAIYTTQGGEQ